ncbi:MAG: hypothetical protein R3B70_06980 [Polyangiaceae bacterium]
MTANYFSEDSDNATDAAYAQLSVPGHELAVSALVEGDKIFGDPATTPTGNSFLRVGTSPVQITYSSATSKFSMSLDGTEPSGFDTSYALAKLVGTMDSTGSTVASAEATSDTSKTDGYYTSDPYNGDAILGFADDTRVRDDAASDILYLNGAVRTNSQANRRTESYRLLSKGGWWDHSDGNRISTTVGDKVEVIQGNYKLVVLGRRASTDGTDRKVTDISGGYELSKKYEYLSGDAKWASWEKSSEIHATKVSSGKDVSYFKGTLKKSVVGKHPDETEQKPVIESHTYADTITNKTWAKTIENYTGAADDWIEHQLSLTYATAMEDIRFGVTMQDMRMFVADHLTLRAAAAVSAMNIAGINVSTFNITPTTLNISVGFGFQYTATRTTVAGNATVFRAGQQVVVAKKDDIIASETKMMSFAAEVAATAIELHSKKSKLAATTEELAFNATRIAMSHLFL